MTDRIGETSAEYPKNGSINHRTVVGKRRRAKTETKIIHAAAAVFARLGPDAPVIDDFLKVAGIARGTFYNHFKSTDELLRATSEYITEELVMRIDGKVRSFNDPATRLGVGIRLWMRWAMAHPSWCLFLARVWNSIDYRLPLSDIQAGIARGSFVGPNPYVAWDVISGTVRQVMFRIAAGKADAAYGDLVAGACLRSLGVRAEQIVEIMAMPLPDVQWDKPCTKSSASGPAAS